LLLGRAQSLAATLENLGWDTTFYEHDDYDVALADPATFKRVPTEKQTLIIGAGMDLFFSSDQLAHESAIPVANENAVVAILQERFGGALIRRQSSEHSIALSIAKKEAAGVVVGFYSGAQGYQGKTVLALNTAALLASEGHPVCLVDLDTDKAGLTTLCGWNEGTLPPVDLRNAVESSTGVVKGPGGVHVITAPLDYPGWSPTPIQINNLLGKLVAQYPYVVLDFGARVASPSTIAALKQCGIVFIVSTPFRGALSAVARFRGKEMAEIGGSKVRAIINRVGADGAMTPRDAAAILGFASAYSTVPEDSAFVAAETKALDGKKYIPPVLGKCEAKKAVKGLVEEIQKSQGVMV
jgi:cellulose biosynthesis protein BcsQ